MIDYTKIVTLIDGDDDDDMGEEKPKEENKEGMGDEGDEENDISSADEVATL